MKDKMLYDAKEKEALLEASRFPSDKKRRRDIKQPPMEQKRKRQQNLHIDFCLKNDEIYEDMGVIVAGKQVKPTVGWK
jgi:hypothetical protein